MREPRPPVVAFALSRSTPRRSFLPQSLAHETRARRADTGWLTHWGEPIANTSSAEVAASLDALLGGGGSFNLYMGFGGTNFGFWAGANGGGADYEPHVTTYDYASPVSEGGAHGVGSDGADKFAAILAVLRAYANRTIPSEPPPPPRAAPAPARLDETAGVFANLAALASDAIRMAEPTNIERYGFAFGLALYSTTLGAPAENATLEFASYPRDLATAFVDGDARGSVYRPEAAPLRLGAVADGSTLDVLVDVMGRLNYGTAFYDPKGLVGEVALGGVAIRDWTLRVLDLDPARFASLDWSSGPSSSSPAFFRGAFELDAPADTFVNTTGWGKGYVWVNGHNLGRFWESRGPTHTLYVPSPFARAGSNDLVLLEMEAPPADLTVRFALGPDYSGPGAAA